MKKTVTDGSTITVTDYLDGFQYKTNALEFFPHAEGYVKATAMGLGGGGNISGYAYNYVYNHTDHLGNVRISYAKDPQTGNLKILDENHYYPFGLRHSTYAQQGFMLGYQDVILAPITNSPYKYKYNGKEFQDELGLNMYDMDMRMYDPAIARWVVLDPVIHHSLSPYNAFDNNPVFWADPGGANSESSDGGSSSSDSSSGLGGKSETDNNPSGVRAMGIPIEAVMATSANTFTSYADSYETTETRNSALIVGEDSPESLENLPDGVSVSGETRDYLSGANVRTFSSTTTTRHEGGGDISGSFLSNIWNNTFTRSLIKDTYSIGLSSNVTAFVGVGSTPINFTLLTRGKAPGIYFTPTVNGAVGSEISADAGVAFSSGNYTGNPGQIQPSMLQGTSYGVSAEIGAGVSVSAGASYAPVDRTNPIKGGGFINGNVQIGVGIGAGVQGNVQETIKVAPLVQF